MRSLLSKPIDDLGRVIRLLAREELRLYLERMETLERIRSGGKPSSGGRKQVWGVLVAFLFLLAAVSVLGPYYFLATASLMVLILVSWTAWQIATHAPEEQRLEISEWLSTRLLPRFRRFRNILFLIGGLLFIMQWVPEMIFLRLSPGFYASISFSQTFHYWAAFIAPSLTGLVGGYRAKSAKLAVGAGICAYIIVSLGIVQPLYRYGGPWLTANWESPGKGTIVVSPSLPPISPVLLLACCVVGGWIPILRGRRKEIPAKKTLMTMVVVTTAILGLFTLYLTAQPAIDWGRRFSEGYPIPADLVWMGDGSVVAIQIYRSLGDIDIGLVRFNRAGGIVWKRTYGGDGWDIPESITRSENGYLVAGVTGNMSGRASHILILKVDEEGELVWNRRYKLGDRDEVGSVISTEDGGYVVAGSSLSGDYGYPHPYLLKIDEKGELVWNRSYRSATTTRATDLVESADGGFVVAGVCSGSCLLKGLAGGSEDVYVLKVNRDGEKLWEETYGGDGWDRAHSITECTDGGYVVAGSTRSLNSGSGDTYALRISESGELVWERTYEGIFDNFAKDVITSRDGGHVLVGCTYNLVTQDDAHVIKIDDKGEMVWTVTYGGLGFQIAHKVVECEQGYLVTGRAGSGMFLLKITPSTQS